MPGALAVAHTGITVRNVDDALSFWVDVMDAQLERRFRLEADFAADVTGVDGAVITAAVVVVAGHRIELLEYVEPTARAHFRPRPSDLGSWHLALEVVDLDSMIECCRERGWQPAGVPRALAAGPRAGTRFAYLHDPDGSTLELIQQGPVDGI